MKAFILAAGFGRRMGELTADCPKPLLPVGGYPLIYYSLFWLWKWGIEEAIINLHYLGERIEQRLAGFRHFPIRFSKEEQILGTAGGIRRCLGNGLASGENLILLNPDTILLAEPEDHPSVALDGLNSLDLDSDYDRPPSLLFLAKRTEPSVPGIEIRGERTATPGAIRFSEDGGLFYMGYSILQTGDPMLSDSKESELGPIWRRQSKEGRLFGKRFAGQALDAGTKEAYLAIQDRFPLPKSHRREWERFLKGLS